MDNSIRSVNKNKLTHREHLFYEKIVQGESAVSAYLTISPGIKVESAYANASRMLRRINEKMDWQQTLDFHGMGGDFLLNELKKCFSAQMENPA